ncbi:hypothetical protein BD309DRAFT_993365 [Dichomitus squalens]|uniref:Uncharacterized protein n=2 Tax=Dichomitus squalens TaxID=114155 RepID=A0A4V2K6X4_9APHY|nr:uncharacterized protein DICSQDRAFT_148818 [Dichomitus squalens LYAD-421 SS1]EJF58898.1 hypothetical protein DICSQDRAFT_148818 [Dichomitus squalens LYAD-421 SS1]TBU24551.1 hypothetical protein BD311DRAFT_671544 [Dichomitus squalens]TBU40028.1 hypothetical protein BD309DRAFT_993365 [Dichomitus squalens]TBU53908.1 hypothetical protein BD310DRAFT_951794 [Dichomitus squalens]
MLSPLPPCGLPARLLRLVSSATSPDSVNTAASSISQSQLAMSTPGCFYLPSLWLLCLAGSM